MSCLPANPEDLQWLVLRTSAPRTCDATGYKVVDDTGKIKAMCAFDWWTHNAVSMHVAIDNPLAARALLRPAFHFVFQTMGKGVLLATIGADNTRCVNLVQRLGFELAHRTPNGWAQGFDLLHFEMRRDDCRWIEHQRRAA